MEIRFQVDQVDRADQLHGGAPAHFLAGNRPARIRLLGQCQSGCAASALEPGDGTDPAYARDGRDAAVQRLWRDGRPSLFRPRRRTAVHVTRRKAGCVHIRPLCRNRGAVPYRRRQWEEEHSVDALHMLILEPSYKVHICIAALRLTHSWVTGWKRWSP